MRRRFLVGFVLVLGVLSPELTRAQWADPRLVAGQVGFGVAVSFFGKLLIARERPGQAIREALLEGPAMGMVAHAGYAIAGRHPQLALVGKTLAQKSTLMGRRSMHGEPVFHPSLYSEWTLTHSFVYLEWKGKPHIEIDVLNAAASSYYLLDDDYHLDWKRSLYGGSLVFRNESPPIRTRGFFVPGTIWIAESSYDDRTVLAHELIHSLQAERGATLADWHYKNLRFNLLVFASGTPALLEGWPQHDKRPHEREADLYAGRD